MISHLKKTSILALIILLTHFDSYTMQPQEIYLDWGGSDSSSSTDTSNVESTPPAPPMPINDSFVTHHEDYDVIVEHSFNPETKDFTYQETTIYREQLDSPDKQQTVDISTQSNTAQEYDHFADFTREQRLQETTETEEKTKQTLPEFNKNMEVDKKLIHELALPQGKIFCLRDVENHRFDSDLILEKVHTIDVLAIALSNPIVTARFQRIKYTYASKYTKKNHEHISKFQPA